MTIMMVDYDQSGYHLSAGCLLLVSGRCVSIFPVFTSETLLLLVVIVNVVQLEQTLCLLFCSCAELVTPRVNVCY